MPRLFNETELEHELLRLYREGAALGYRATRFYQKFTSHCKRYIGGVAAVRDTIRKDQTGGFEFLEGQNRVDLSLERLVLKAEWTHLFTDQDRAIAQKKLARKSK